MNTATQFSKNKFRIARPPVYRVYTVPVGSKIYCPIIDGSKYLVVGLMGSMHSPCMTEKGTLVYLSNAQPLKIVEDHYEFA